MERDYRLNRAGLIGRPVLTKALDRPFIRLVAQIYDDPDVLALPHAEFRLYINALAWSKAKRTDGALKEEDVKRLSVQHRTGIKALQGLVSAGFFFKNGTGAYHIKNYERYQVTTEEEEELREVRARAGSVGGKRSGATRRAQGEANAEANASENEANAKANAKQMRKQNGKQNEADLRPQTLDTRPVSNETETLPVVPLEANAQANASPKPRRLTPARLVMLAYVRSLVEEYGRDPRWLPDETRESLVRDWLNKGYSLNDLLDAAVGWRRSGYHRGENPSRTKYNSFELIFRDRKHIEQFRDLERLAHEAETPFVDSEEPDWQKARREALEKLWQQQQGGPDGP